MQNQIKEDGEIGDPETLKAGPTREGHIDFNDLVHPRSIECISPYGACKSTFRDLLALS